MKKLIGLIILSSLLSFPLFAKGNKTFERNISIAEGPVFMPKGEFIFGGTVSYNSFNFDDFDFITNIIIAKFVLHFQINCRIIAWI